MFELLDTDKKILKIVAFIIYIIASYYVGAFVLYDSYSELEKVWTNSNSNETFVAVFFILVVGLFIFSIIYTIFGILLLFLYKRYYQNAKKYIQNKNHEYYLFTKNKYNRYKSKNKINKLTAEIKELNELKKIGLSNELIINKLDKKMKELDILIADIL